MYTPARFRITDPDVVRDFIERNSFGILLSVAEGEIHDTHVPLFLSEDGNYLMGHIARPNTQWKGWEEDARVKVIFHGPHTYISPRYYKNDGYVPTWNYTAVSISGSVEIIDSPVEAAELIRRLIENFESGSSDPWEVDTTSPDVMKQLKGVVCFRIRIEKVEAKFKLNQDKPEEDRLSVIGYLKASADPTNVIIAEMMEESISASGTASSTIGEPAA